MVTITNGTFDALIEVLNLAEQVCDYHEAKKYRDSSPDYIEVKLLEACENAREILNNP